MIISIATLFPDLYTPFVQTSLVGRAIEKGHISIDICNMFQFAAVKERIDSPTYGPGAGMLIRPELVEKAVNQQEHLHGSAYKIFFSPHGKKLDQSLLRDLAHTIQQKKHIMLLPARYEGMDARVEEEYADCILSIGDYVLMGGDIPAMVFMEGLLRLIPDIVGKQESVERDSFSNAFLDYPEYTEPLEWHGRTVPDIIRSGNHKVIQQWREQQAVTRSVIRHFDWVRSHVETAEDIHKVAQVIPSHYIVLMHDQVMLEQGREGTSSVTSLDIHDIARSAATYGIKHYFIVTPLQDQQKIISKLLSFWNTDVGINYNPHRHAALRTVTVVSHIDEVIEDIEKREGSKPLLLATAARILHKERMISYADQELIWSERRPVLFVFGTARGLAPSLIERVDYICEPVSGFSEFNHLSVRSAVAIILDRWLGIHRATRRKRC